MSQPNRKRATRPGQGGPHGPDPRRGCRQPQPRGRERRPSRHRQGLRRRPGQPQPGRGRILAGARRLGALSRGAGRSLRTEDDAPARDRAGDTGLGARRAGAVDRVPLRRPSARRPRGRDGVPDDPGPDHRPLVGTGADPVDRALVRAGRRHRGPRAADLRRPADPVRLELGLLHHPAARGRRPLPRVALRPRPRQRVDGAGGQPQRRALGADGRRPRPRHQLRPGPRSGHRRGRARRSSRWRRSPPSSSASDASPTRSTTSTSPAGGSSGSRPAPGSSSSAR